MHDVNWSEYSDKRPKRFQVWNARAGKPTAWVGSTDDLDEMRGLASPRKPTVVLEAGVPVLRVPPKGQETGPLAEPGPLERRRQADLAKLHEAAEGTRVQQLGLSARRARRITRGLEGLRLERDGRWVVVRKAAP